VNHVPGTWAESVTHKNFGFSDSAEAFMLISGIAVGLSYGGRFKLGSRLLQTLKAWRRAAVLYLTNLATTMATLAIFSAGAIWFARPDLLQEINIAAVIDRTPEALVGIITLGHQIGYNNILPTYAAVMLMVPFYLWIANRSPAAAVAISGAIWLGAGLLHFAPRQYPNEHIWFLNPFSWQFLFVIGMAATMHVRRGGEIRASWALGLMSAGYLLLALVWTRFGWWGAEATLGLPMVLGEFNKTFLSLPRLLHVLALAYLIVSIPAIANMARVRPSHPLAVLGRHSLPVFVAGTLLSIAAQVLVLLYERGLIFDTSLLAIGIAAQFALAYWLNWLPQIGWGDKPAASMQRPEAGLVSDRTSAVPPPRRTR
jgi:hypothetical protein